MLQNYIQLCNLFNEHLSVFNIDYIIQHVIYNVGETQFRRGGDWDSLNQFSLNFDQESISTARHYKVYIDGKSPSPKDTIIDDVYLRDILFRDFKFSWETISGRSDSEVCDESYKEALNALPSKYDRDMHIKYFIWKATPYFKESQENRDVIDKLANKILKPSKYINFSEIEFHGIYYDVLDFNSKYFFYNLRLKSTKGVFGNLTYYHDYTFYLSYKQRINIPEYLYIPSLPEKAVISVISKGVFNNLPNIESIKIPASVRKIEWSFWECKSLVEIEVNPANKYYTSLDGVLYSKDCKRLIAYPNNKGDEYIVPLGVEIIENCSFKDCDNLKSLILPASIKKIGLNALYRCIGLQQVICEFSKSAVVNEGFWGDHKMGHLQWIYRE